MKLKSLLLATLTAATLSTACAREAIAQVDYYSHPYYAYEGYGSATDFYGYIRLSDLGSYLNGRQGPGTNFTAIASFRSGDRVYVYRQARGADGYSWYLVYGVNSRQLGWVQGPYLRQY